MTAAELGERLVAAVNGVYGRHAGHRAAHAKGVLCSATFTPSADAARLSRAAHFAAEEVRAHVRFSNGSGDPAVHDGKRDGRGIGVKFYLPDGSTTDIVGLTLPCFFVRTPEDFLAFNEARAPDPATGKPDMARLGKYFEAHPEALPAVQAAVGTPPPESYARLAYNSIHSYWLVDGDGARRAIRYRFEPEAGEGALEDDDAQARDADYLAAELAQRLESGPVGFRMLAVLAGEGDPIDDPTVAWPDERERVELGRLDLTGLAFDRERDGDILVFDPTRVTDGIESSGDPILHARADAYRASVALRAE
jgi:catalase